MDTQQQQQCSTQREFSTATLTKTDMTIIMSKASIKKPHISEKKEEAQSHGRSKPNLQRGSLLQPTQTQCPNPLKKPSHFGEEEERIQKCREEDSTTR
jgi:hypothetical protein